MAVNRFKDLFSSSYLVNPSLNTAENSSQNFFSRTVAWSTAPQSGFNKKRKYEPRVDIVLGTVNDCIPYQKTATWPGGIVL